MVNCPTCAASVSSVSIVNVNLDEKPAVRSGKWTDEEKDFAAAILAIYENGALPLANGTPIRTVLARLLNCTLMRVSKKFQNTPLGKETYEPSTGNQSEFNLEKHAIKMRHFCKLESAFRDSIACKNSYSSYTGSAVDEIRKSARQFWVQTFLTFAIFVEQSIDGIVVSRRKKKNENRRCFLIDTIFS